MSIFDNDLRRLATALDRQHTAHTTSATVTVASEAARGTASLTTAVDTTTSTLNTHLANVSNPHSVTAAQAGAQPHHADLDSIVGLGASGLLRKLSGAYSLDTTVYQPSLGSTPTGPDTYFLTQYDGDTAPSWETFDSALGYTPMPSFNRSDIFNNAGHTHGLNTDFNALPNTYAAHYVGRGNGTAFVTNGPSWATNTTHFYGVTMGLGSEFAPSSYASQLYWPRTGDPYLALRFQEAGTWTAWSKIYAGYADTAGNSATTSQTTFGSLNVGSASGATEGEIKASGSIATSAGSKWQLAGYTTDAVDRVSNGYVTVTIDGTAYKLMTRA